MSARQRLSKLLLRQGIQYREGKTWTVAHTLWLRRQKLDRPTRQTAYEAAFGAMTAVIDRRDRLDVAIAQLATDSEFTPVVNRLGCLLGISTLTGVALAVEIAVEIGDWSRLDGRRIGSYLGLTPSEHSSGQSRSLGGITKTGNGHARRLLVEAAWHHRRNHIGHPRRSCGPVGNVPVPRRVRVVMPGTSVCISVWLVFNDRKKRSSVAYAAIARELAGWCWSLAVME